ncbi:FtsX-like permease family protein [Paenirhodobacter populi]|uniref:FtsX-like permease family protein n=1 Tax=Paenirhodobacter populi TaxID=2306993 RepID=UPI000FE2AA07|nr:FtsX-like permease family protein [Sinirhodobacter populi]RWR11290.1 ABC transporter permease [Sinirhodobacter populi]
MIRFVLADLKRLWAGSVVIVLLIALAVALGVGVSLQERALRLGSARAAEKFDLVIGAPGSETQLILSSVFLQPSALPLISGDNLIDLSEDPRVDWAAPVGFGDFHAGYPIVGTTTTLIDRTGSGFAAGHIFDVEGEAVIGSAVDLAIGETITPTHGRLSEGGHAHGGVTYTVAGKLNPTGTPWDRAILVPIQAVWHVHGLGHEEDEDHDHEEEAGHDDHDHDHDHAEEAGHHDDEDEHEHGHEGIDPDAPLDEHWHRGAVPGLPAILVKPKTIADAYKLRQEYRGNGQTLAVFPGEVLTSLYATLGDMKKVLSVIAAGAQLLVAAALLLVTVIHVGQRRRQIGALRAFGAPGGAVFGIVWLELFALVAAGVLLGFALGYAAAQVLSGIFAAERGFGLPVAFAAEDGVLLLVLLAVAAVLALLPAVLAYRQAPAEALRG